jgi:hypothetical protein
MNKSAASSASRPGAAAIAESAPLAENQIVMLANWLTRPV